ncbi:MAG: WD40 repeat domain-containing protein, partial [Candidatus Thorarchaeota archaeon]
FLFRQNNGISSPLTCISVGPKGKFVVCGNAASSIFVVDTGNGKLKETILGHTDKISGVSFVHNRFHVLSCSWDTTTRFWDSKEKGDPLVLKHGSEVKTLTISQTLEKGVTGSRDGELKIFSLSTMKNLRNIPAHISDISGLAILDDDAKLVTSSWDGECKLWNLTTYELEKEIIKKKERIRALAATPDGLKIALGMHSGKILLIDLENPSETTQMVGHTDIVESLSIDTTGERLVSGSWDRTIRLWSLNSNKEISSGNLLTGITAVAWDPKNEVVYSTDFSGAITSWRI